MTYTARDICYNTRQANATLNYVCNNPPRIVAWNQTVSLRYGAEVRGPAWHSRVGRWTCSVSRAGGAEKRAALSYGWLFVQTAPSWHHSQSLIVYEYWKDLAG